jgi:hypothetical protein
MLGGETIFRGGRQMGLSDLFKRPVPQVTASVAPSSPTTDVAPPSPNSAKISYESLQFKEGKPYLALIGQTFDVWGVVDVVGDTRSHIAVKDVPAEILKRTGATNFDDVAAFDRKIVLTNTKGFHDLPREEAFDVINTLSENLMSYVDDMKERLEDAEQDYTDDAKGLRELLRDTKKEFMDYWSEDLNRFRDEVLPQTVVDYWERQRDEAQLAAERAEQARVRALTKVRKTSSE